MKTFKTFPETDCPRANALVVEPFCLGDFFIMETEIWKDVPDYEGLYQAGSLGNIKSIGYRGGKILKPGDNGKGYLYVFLCKNKIHKRHYVHRIIYETFNGKTDLHIDHIIEGNKSDNRLCNLQALNNRQNSTKFVISNVNKTSRYIGVCWDKRVKKWRVGIRINNVITHLGYYSDELEAAEAYQNKLSILATN